MKAKSETNRKNAKKKYEKEQSQSDGTTTAERPQSDGTATDEQPQSDKNRIEKNKEEESKESVGGTGGNVVPPGGVTSPKNTLKDRMGMFYNSLIPYMGKYQKEMLRDFYNYWSEPDRAKNPKMRFEKEKTWEMSRRLTTWAKKEIEYSRSSDKTSIFDEIARLNAQYSQQAQIEQ